VIHLISRYCVYIFRYNILLHAWHDTLLLVHVDLIINILVRYIKHLVLLTIYIYILVYILANITTQVRRVVVRLALVYLVSLS
jgi:hypothetical protein